MADAVANAYGVELRRVLTGFKFIGEQIAMLEADNETDRYIFGFEESYGYLSGSHVRDKDAVNASMLACEMTAWYKKQGMTLAEAIDALYEKFGFYRNDLASFAYEGAAGMQKMADIMDNLRANPPKTLDGKAVIKVVDYNLGVNGLPKSNVLEYQTECAKILVRPSGTEPKVKIYLSAREDSMQKAKDTNNRISKEMTENYMK
jgi:phosphoglucomutase